MMSNTYPADKRTVRLLAEDGSVLSTSLLSNHRPAGEVVFDCVSSRGALLGYYFAQGKRRVFIDMGEIRLPGRLSTAWVHGERIWRAELISVGQGNGDGPMPWPLSERTSPRGGRDAVPTVL